MELEQMPQPGPGMCGSDREVFERVWRRVMETGGGESPVEVVPAEEAALPAPAQPLPAPAVPAPAAVDPEDALCCLGPASAAYGGALQRFIEGELQDAVTYAALARRGRHRAAARFAALADQERRHAKRLSTAYFLISGVRYWPVDRVPNPSPAPFSAALREHFMEEQRGAAAYQTAAAETADPCLHELFLELAGEEDSHAWLLRSVLEQL